jgi:hypothetical protein
MKSLMRYLNLIFLASTGVTLIALQLRPEGWIVWLVGLIFLCLTDRTFARNGLLIYISLAILGLIPINTNIDMGHMLEMGGAMFLTIALPFFISKYVYKEALVQFPFRMGRRWLRREVAYIVLAGVVSYFVLPFYLGNTGAYQNWAVEPGAWNLGKLFFGTNVLGIWDELFFICTALAILKTKVPFWAANLTQAALFTSFLFELGFTGWAPFLIYPFALSQGYIFKKTHSLLYIITIHLTIDLVLYLALIDAHHPTWLPIFITG